ncbi:hypothetical protein DPMN_013552 [Dreissena polymorpha]|uniref:Uncharacterized protein n=1 Tax=Dreissena polymorpha TaxID=45954 RepID=A0A9D4N843_DREPO|nr:hypothetical protein DPMN_013552 [Dreissena polymorpha]
MVVSTFQPPTLSGDPSHLQEDVVSKTWMVQWSVTGYPNAEQTPTATPSLSLELDCGTSYQSTSQFYRPQSHSGKDWPASNSNIELS